MTGHHISKASRPIGFLFLCTEWLIKCFTSVIVSPEESWGYYAFVIVMLLPPLLRHRFLVCIPHPAVLIQSFSNSAQMCLVPRSRRQWILGTLWFHWGPKEIFLWALRRPELSTDFLHIHTKYALDQGLDTKWFLASCNSICGHQGGKFVCFLCTL